MVEENQDIVKFAVIIVIEEYDKLQAALNKSVSKRTEAAIAHSKLACQKSNLPDAVECALQMGIPRENILELMNCDFDEINVK